MHRISIALLLVPMIQAQQCCVWSGLVAQVNSGSGTAESVKAAPTSPPTSSCSAPYSWTSCSSGCIMFSCTLSPGDPAAYAGTCSSSNGVTASAIQGLIQSGGYPNAACSQQTGITQANAADPPLTTSTVASSAATGSVGGSIAGTLVATFIGWILNSSGIASKVLSMVMKKVGETIEEEKKRKQHDEDMKQLETAVVSVIENAFRGHLKKPDCTEASLVRISTAC